MVARLGGLAVVQQAASLDGLPLDAFALEEDPLPPAEVNVRRGEIAQALVHAAVVVVLDEGRALAARMRPASATHPGGALRGS